MLARALLAKGDRDAAASLVRDAWRNDECSAEVEKRVLEMFGNMLTPADHKARMEHRFYVDDIAGRHARRGTPWRQRGRDRARRARR